MALHAGAHRQVHRQHLVPPLLFEYDHTAVHLVVVPLQDGHIHRLVVGLIQFSGRGTDHLLDAQVVLHAFAQAE